MPRQIARRTWEIFRNEGLLGLLKSVLEVLIEIPRRMYYLVRTKTRYYKYRIEFDDSAPEPYEIIYVDPSDVDNRIYPWFQLELSDFGTYVFDGSWDEDYSSETIGYTPSSLYLVVPLEDTLFFDTVKDWINRDAEWNDTEWYSLDIRNKSKNKADKRENKIKNIYKSMNSEGYLSQRELLTDSENYSVRRNILLPPEHFEVEVAVGRDGEIFFVDGKHRFSIAKYTNITSIPVRVLVRHKEWQEIRHEIYKKVDSGSVSELNPRLRSYLEHPDVQNIRQLDTCGDKHVGGDARPERDHADDDAEHD